MTNDTRSRYPDSRYPGYDVLDGWDSSDWDDQTREIVRKRLEEVPEIRFLSDQEARTLRAVVDRLVPQPERGEGTRIPVVPFIDEMLHTNQTDGYRYETLPPMREAWQRGLAGLDQAAQALFGQDFDALTGELQEEVLERLGQGDPPGQVWETMDASRFFGDELCAEIVSTYYAHPLAWSELGYGGPSSPRGHVRKWENTRDDWDPEETGHDR